MSNNDIQRRIANNASVKDRDLNAFRAGLQLIPSVGTALDKLMFGVLDDLRSKRLEETLSEIGETLKALELGNHIDENEDFGNLLQDVAPPLSRSSNEDRRRRFRDLILNATQIPPGDNRWEEAYFASGLLNSIGAPGLAILSILARCKNDTVWMFLEPYPYIHDGLGVDRSNHDFGKVIEPSHTVDYEQTVVKEWILRLQEMRLIGIGTGNGGFLGVISLSPLGKLLVQWTVSDRFKPTDIE